MVKYIRILNMTHLFMGTPTLIITTRVVVTMPSARRLVALTLDEPGWSLWHTEKSTPFVDRNWQEPYLRLALQGVLDESSALDYLANLFVTCELQGDLCLALQIAKRDANFPIMTSWYIRGDKQISSGGIMKPGSIVPSGLTANRVTQIPMDLLSSCFHGEIQYISIWYVWTLGILHFWTTPYPSTNCSKGLTRLHRSGRPEQIRETCSDVTGHFQLVKD
jgi:hypothetical protein